MANLQITHTEHTTISGSLGISDERYAQILEAYHQAVEAQPEGGMLITEMAQKMTETLEITEPNEIFYVGFILAHPYVKQMLAGS